MAAESGRLQAGQGKRSKGRNLLHPSPPPIRSESSITALQWAALVLLAKNPSRLPPSPHVNFTTVSGGGCFSQNGPVNGVDVSLAVNVPPTTFSRPPVFVSFPPPPVSPIDLTSSASMCGLSPPRLGHLVRLGHFVIQGFIITLGVMVTPGCSSILSSCQSMSHH